MIGLLPFLLADTLRKAIPRGSAVKNGKVLAEVYFVHHSSLFFIIISIILKPACYNLAWSRVDNRSRPVHLEDRRPCTTLLD